ncbi:hypothetical protein [Klebsiella pneumoniae]|uniref:hypothetical protein n=1 Tax=Klebsiella pneumoniae TaxID=573 RepID=UPI000F21D8A1|nr:hypothetical protein [Klebsiella pneumoniae]VCZ33954.1 3D-(3,5/4)-trihydroxycyclohexane-1,2-dione hydrolase [Klebsiella pneumoniae]
MAAIKASRKPLIVCGGGVKYSGAGEALSRFAERYGCLSPKPRPGRGRWSRLTPERRRRRRNGCLAANLLAKEADLVIGVGTRFSDFTTASKWIFQHPEVRFLNINVSNFDAWKLDGIAMLTREAMTALDAALADSGWQAGWGAQIESVQSRQLKETQRVYQAVWQEKSFVPEIDDHLDRESVYREFRQITDSTLTQSSVLGVLNETLPAEAVIVAAAGSLPGDLQRVWRNRAENTYHGVRLLLHGI